MPRKSRKLSNSIEKGKIKCRQIPKEILLQTLEMANNPNHPSWIDKNISCEKAINFIHEKDLTLSLEMSLKLKYARYTLLQRDWKNLAKILTLNCFKETIHGSNIYPIFVKYAAVCLMYNETELLNRLFKTILPADNTIDILEMCTNFPWKND